MANEPLSFHVAEHFHRFIKADPFSLSTLLRGSFVSRLHEKELRFHGSVGSLELDGINNTEYRSSDAGLLSDFPLCSLLRRLSRFDVSLRENPFMRLVLCLNDEIKNCAMLDPHDDPAGMARRRPRIFRMVLVEGRLCSFVNAVRQCPRSFASSESASPILSNSAKPSARVRSPPSRRSRSMSARRRNRP